MPLSSVKVPSVLYLKLGLKPHVSAVARVFPKGLGLSCHIALYFDLTKSEGFSAFTEQEVKLL